MGFNKYKYFDVRKKSLAFPATIFRKLIIAQQHYMQVAYTRLHPIQTKNAEPKSSSIAGLERSRGFLEVKAPRVRDNGIGWW